MLDESIDIRTLKSTVETIVVGGHGYFPVIAVTGSNELLVVVRGGAGHMGLGGRLDAVRSTDGGATWTQPAVIADSERDDRNPALGVAPDGTAVLAYHWQGSYDADGLWNPGGPQDTRVVRSADGGESWTDDRFLSYEPLRGASPFGKIRRSDDGTLFMPIYGGDRSNTLKAAFTVGPASGLSCLLQTGDQGKTWRDPICVARGLSEADLLILSEDNWLFAARSDKKDEQAIYTCRSSDQGHTWGDLMRVTGPREHPPDLTDLGEGIVLLTYGRRHPPFGVDGRLSRDGGRSWETHRVILATDLPGGDTGYPSTAFLQDGSLITVYYTAGTREKPSNPYEAVNVSCRAVRYSRDELLSAVSKVHF